MSEKSNRNDRMSESEWIRMGSEEAITAVGGAARWVDGVVEKERQERWLAKALKQY